MISVFGGFTLQPDAASAPGRTAAAGSNWELRKQTSKSNTFFIFLFFYFDEEVLIQKHANRDSGIGRAVSTQVCRFAATLLNERTFTYPEGGEEVTFENEKHLIFLNEISVIIK